MKRKIRTAAWLLVLTAGPPLVAIWIQRAASGPDVGRTFTMRAALVTKRAADRQVNLWAGVSAKAAQAYNQARL